MKYGGDYLAACMYESAMLKSHIPGRVGGIFLWWGKRYALSTLKKMCRSKKFSEIVVHLAPFDYSHKYPFSKYLKQAYKDAAIIEKVSKEYPSTVIMLSIFCEHNHKKNQMIPVFNRLREIAPSCLRVNSVWKGDFVPDSIAINEIHLETSKLKKKPEGEYTVAFDGFGGNGTGDVTDTNIHAILQIYSDARHIRIWNFRYNGKYGHKDPAPISGRKHFPNVHYLRGHDAMMKNREGVPSWDDSILWKPFADDHGEGGKDNKAMCIIPWAKDFVEVLDINGNVINRMKEVLPKHINKPKGSRFYSDLYAYQIGNIAQANTGSRKIRIKYKDRVTPETDADLRSGLFK